MDQNRTLNVVLFALTGFGNPVLKALANDKRVNVAAVFTVKYDKPFPYYEEEQLVTLCSELDVQCYHGVKVNSEEGMSLLRQHAPDLIIVATFKQILADSVLSLPSLGVVNLHPSLLPRYRGPCPTNAALLNDDDCTGITAHYVTDELDEGDVLLQRTLDLHQVVNDGQLRERLARMAGEMIPDLVGMFANHVKPAGLPQDHHLATFAPKPTVEDGYLELAKDLDTMRRKVKAFNPLPGTSILVKEHRVAVGDCVILPGTGSDAVVERDESIDVTINGQTLRLFKTRGQLATQENNRQGYRL